MIHETGHCILPELGHRLFKAANGWRAARPWTLTRISVSDCARTPSPEDVAESIQVHGSTLARPFDEYRPSFPNGSPVLDEEYTKKAKGTAQGQRPPPSTTKDSKDPRRTKRAAHGSEGDDMKRIRPVFAALALLPGCKPRAAAVPRQSRRREHGEQWRDVSHRREPPREVLGRRDKVGRTSRRPPGCPHHHHGVGRRLALRTGAPHRGHQLAGVARGHKFGAMQWRLETTVQSVPCRPKADPTSSHFTPTKPPDWRGIGGPA